MTVEEIKKLINDEDNKVLRKPNTLKGKKYEDVLNAHKTLKIIIDDVIKNDDREHFLNSMLGKRKMRSVGITKIKTINKVVCMHKIQSYLGEGVFFDAHKLFDDGNYPKWIKPNHCFSNSHLHILQTGIKAKILSGIIFIGKPILHSVILVGDNIIDFNYNLVMSKDLYLNLTHFEILEELDYKQILDNKNVIKGMKNIQSYVLNFAFDEAIETEKARFNQTKEGVAVM